MLFSYLPEAFGSRARACVGNTFPPPRGQALPLPLRKSSWLLLLQWLLTTAWPSGPFLPSVSFCNTVTFGPLS